MNVFIHYNQQINPWQYEKKNVRKQENINYYASQMFLLPFENTQDFLNTHFNYLINYQ